jgi:pimeloyl-ACP methyl ester carboxylesterase
MEEETMRGSTPWFRHVCLAAISAVGLALMPIQASAATTFSCTLTAGGVKLCTGHTTETSGLDANYKIEVPPGWNQGTLVLYSHGYDSFTTPNPATDAGDPLTGAWLLQHGVALAGSAYAKAGWSVQQAFEDQIAVLDLFNAKFSHPSRTIAWGHSLGGLITAGLIQLHPNRFQGAIPMCGVVEGGVAIWNEALDAFFAFTTLQAPGAFNWYNLNPATAYGEYLKAKAAFAAAQATPAGRARIALAAALNNIPGWFNPVGPEPAANDWVAREANQYSWISGINLLFGFLGRAELEARAGGRYSWNTGVNYKEQVAHSTGKAEVKALYEAAGLDLEDELETLNDTTRISANPSSVAYLSRYINFNGEIDQPVLTMHTTGDGLVEPTAEQAYASVIRSADNEALLRQVYVHRAGHCTFTPAETITAFQALKHRLDTGKWSGLGPSTMNMKAAALGAAYNAFYVGTPPVAVPVGPSFIDFKPTQFLRPLGRGEDGSDS